MPQTIQVTLPNDDTATGARNSGMRAAVISGYGELPVLSVKSLKASGAYVVTVAVAESCSHPRCLEALSDKFYSFSAGQVGAVLKTLKREKITHALLIGKIEISLLDRGLKLDLKALWMLARLKFRSTDTISLSVVRELEKKKISVLSQKQVLAPLIPEEGVFSAAKPDESMIKDIITGFQAAKSIGGIDIGQSVVVKDGRITAVESAEGTDVTFARGCAVAVDGGVAVKVSKPAQDPRFDMPVVGVDTLANIAANGGKVLAVEAGETLIVNMNACVEFADKNGMVFAAVKVP